MERTFCFIDLAGFTALTDAHGDTEAVALLDRFLAMTESSLGSGDELVKSIGDAVMIASRTPEEAVEAVGTLLSRCREASGFPLARAGAHHGPALARNRDYFGAAVNLASRVAAQASGGQFLATRAVADSARSADIEVRALGAVGLRNIPQPVELFELSWATYREADVIDPVCRMTVDATYAAGWLRFAGCNYWFCSLRCAAAFSADPDRHVSTGPSPTI